MWGRGVPLPTGETGLKRGLCSLPEIFSIFSLEIAIFVAFRAAIFTVQRTVLYADHAD